MTDEWDGPDFDNLSSGEAGKPRVGGITSEGTDPVVWVGKVPKCAILHFSFQADVPAAKESDGTPKGKWTAVNKEHMCFENERASAPNSMPTQ